MIQPNCLELARKELQTITFNNGFKIPTEIKDIEAQHYYACIGVRARDSNDGFTKIYDGAMLWASRNKWNKMKRQISQGVFKREFADVYDKIIILHNPTKPVAKPKPKGLTTAQKTKITKLFKKDMSAEEIAETLEVELALVTAHIEKKAK